MDEGKIKHLVIVSFCNKITHTWADEEQGWVTLFVRFSKSTEWNTLGLVVANALVHSTGLLSSSETEKKGVSQCQSLEDKKTVVIMSSITHPGSKALTRIPYWANSVARPFTMLVAAPLLAL